MQSSVVCPLEKSQRRQCQTSFLWSILWKELRNSCHSLDHVYVIGEDGEVIEADIHNAQITVQCGYNFGMVCVEIECQCGCTSFKAYFFELKPDDYIIQYS